MEERGHLLLNHCYRVRRSEAWQARFYGVLESKEGGQIDSSHVLRALGVWLVGSQVAPGTYSAATREGCYWERLRDFTGTLGGIIANDFVAGGGARMVSISGGDVGFNTDDDCGTWSRMSAAASAEPAGSSSRTQSRDEMERARALNRAQRGGLRR